MASTQRFRRFEKVTITRSPRYGPHIAGQVGTVLWADPPQQPGRPDDWAYSVYLPGMDRCITALESNLGPTGDFDPPEAHLGTRFEISHDLLPDERGEFSFVEGTYRLPGQFWQVMIFWKADVPALRYQFGTWNSGITGINFWVPNDHRLNKPYVLRAMSTAFPANEWSEVMGPDSMILR